MLPMLAFYILNTFYLFLNEISHLLKFLKFSLAQVHPKTPHIPILRSIITFEVPSIILFPIALRLNKLNYYFY